MTGYEGMDGTPTVVELDYLQLNNDNSLHLRVTLANGMNVSLDLAENSSEMREFLTVVGRVVTANLASLADGSVIVAGITPTKPSEENA